MCMDLCQGQFSRRKFAGLKNLYNINGLNFPPKALTKSITNNFLQEILKNSLYCANTLTFSVWEFNISPNLQDGKNNENPISIL